jgi:hypothetical protein
LLLCSEVLGSRISGISMRSLTREEREFVIVFEVILLLCSKVLGLHTSGISMRSLTREERKFVIVFKVV